MKKLLLALPLSALLVLLAACGGGVVNSNLDQATAQQFGTSYGMQAADYQVSLLREPMIPDMGTAAAAAQALGVPPQVLTRAGISALQADCVTESGFNVDSDNDGIPDNATATYNCNESGMSMTGTVAVRDTDNSDEYSYELDIDNLRISFSHEGTTSTLYFDMESTLAYNAGTFDLDVDFTFGGEGTDVDSFEMRYVLDQTYDSNNASAPFADGGTITFTGSITLTEGGNRYVLDSASTPNLVYEGDDPTCDTGFSSGGMRMSDNAGNRLDISYTCAQATISYNGDTLATF